VLCCACSAGISLTQRGTLVHHVERVDMPTGCNLLGDVSIGIPPDAARPHSQEELLILMRNKAGELGGNYVVVDQSSNHPGNQGETIYSGRGIAYACPQQPRGRDPLTAGAPDEGSDGEEGGGGEGGGEEGGGDEGGEGDLEGLGLDE
jgi:hypothetical protein